MPLLLTIFATIILNYSYSQSQNTNISDFGLGDPKLEIENVAKKSLDAYLNLIPVGNEGQYGFVNRREFSMAKLGSVYRLLTLSDKYFTDKVIDTSRSYIVNTNEFLVPITVNGHYRALLTVARMGGVWKTVGLSSAELAKELELFERSHKRDSPDRFILRIFQLESDFVYIINESPKEGLVYFLNSARQALGISISDTSGHSLSEIMLAAHLKNKIR